MLLSAIQPDAKLRFIENPQKIENLVLYRCNHKNLGSSKIETDFVHNNLDMFTCNFEWQIFVQILRYLQFSIICD